jgi:hypothetical protein
MKLSANPFDWTREQALEVVNQSKYDAQGIRISGQMNRKGWDKGEQYLRRYANDAEKGLKFDGTKYVGGRTRRNRRKQHRTRRIHRTHRKRSTQRKRRTRRIAL